MSDSNHNQTMLRRGAGPGPCERATILDQDLAAELGPAWLGRSQDEGLRVRTGVQAGGLMINHNETMMGGRPGTLAQGARPAECRPTPGSLRLRTGVRAGGLVINHNETGPRPVRKPG